MPRKPSPPGLTHLRIAVGDGFYMGPGRADLMELIAETGSISAAGKRMNMSYKRAWSLVQALNEGFAAPLVTASRGGASQGGAGLTAEGVAVLTHYRRMQERTRAAIGEDIEALTALMADMSGKK